MKDPVKNREYQRKWYAANKEVQKARVKAYKQRNKDALRARRHGISKKQYDEMLAKYDGKCWVCKETAAFEIDHDHACCPGKDSCGKCVRGVVCGLCNRMMGMAGDRIDILEAAVIYLQQPQEGKLVEPPVL